MNGPLQRPLHGIAIYNPDLLSKQELIAHFVARQPLLQRLLEDLRRGGQGGAAQHHLLLGQRGMGKTTLLRRLRFAIEDDAELNRYWLPLTFPEEQYNVVRLSDLYLNCIDALGDALEQIGRQEETKTLDEAVEALPDRDETRRAEGALAILMDHADRVGKRLVLLIDNLDLILERLKGDQWAIRELLSAESRLLLIGASAGAIEATYKYKEPFYDFFQVHELKGLNETETREVLLALSRQSNSVGVERILDEDPARIRTLHALAGGNPRTVVLLYSVLAQGTEGDVRSDLERLLDKCTPLYKARFESLPTQSQQVVDAMAIHWDPISAGELAAIVRLDTNAVSSLLNRLAQQGVVEKVAYHPASKTGFQIAERFFNIWYLMRASRRVRRRLIWLVEFLKLFYGRDQLQYHALRHLRRDRGANSDSRLQRAEYSLALAQVVDESPLRSALESTAMHSLMMDRDLRRKISSIIDLQSADASLKPLVTHHQWAAEFHEAISLAKVGWESWDPALFSKLLGGSFSLSPSEKMQIAAAIGEMPLNQYHHLTDSLKDELQHFSSLFGLVATEQLREAFRQGYIMKLHDVAGAEAAAIAFDASEMPAIAIAMDITNHGPSDARLNALKAALSGSQSSYPWLIWTRHTATSEEIEHACKQVARFAGDSAITWSNLANVLCTRLARYTDAEDAYRKAIELDPTWAFPWDELGDLLRDHLARYSEAEAAYRKAIEIDPTFAFSWYSLGGLLEIHFARYDEAEAAYRKAAEIDPTLVFPWHCLGRLLENHFTRYDEAEAAYRKATELAPTLVFPWHSLGDLLQHHLAQYPEAEAAYRKALELNPEDAAVWLDLGDLLEEHLARHDDAETAFRTATELDPSNVDAWNALALNRYLRTKVDDETEAAARRAVSLDREDQYALHTLALILVHRENWTEAASLARRLLGEATPEFLENAGGSLITFFQKAIRAGHAADSLKLLQDVGLVERWRPLVEALTAIAAGTKAHLHRVAPEIRQPAEQLIKELVPEGLP
jgi:tetratricopeptide (TPR) repeat protein